MGDFGGEGDFMAKAAHCLGVGGDAGEDCFEGDFALELGVVGLVDFAHSAGAQAALDAVTLGDYGAWLEYVGGFGGAGSGGRGGLHEAAPAGILFEQGEDAGGDLAV